MATSSTATPRPLTFNPPPPAPTSPAAAASCPSARRILRGGSVPRPDEEPPSGNPGDPAIREDPASEEADDAGGAGAAREAAPASPPATDESEEDRGAEAEDRERAIGNGAKAAGGVGGGGSDVISVIQPHSQLPKPEAPPMSRSPPRDVDAAAPILGRSQSTPGGLPAVDMPAIGKFIRDRSNSFSAAIVKRLSSLKEKGSDDDGGKGDSDFKPNGVTEINLSGLKVVVTLKTEERPEKELRGRISFFSRSNCRDCTAVRCFFRERGLKFVEINVDVYPQREKELVERTGSSQVPQIFFNEKLFGGLVALNSLRNSGGFEQRLREMLAGRCSAGAPAPPVYGFDDPEVEEEGRADEAVGIVRVLRQRLPIQDRLMKMKIVKNCFAGAEMVEVLIHHLDCGRKKAVEIGKKLAKKHFFHHVFGENDFEDGNHFYRFIEHEPFIPRCYNFRGSTNDSEPKRAAEVGLRMTKIMSAILESYASEDRRHLDYGAISKGEEFRRYVNLSQKLHRVDLLELSPDERLAFFLNLHNAMVIHAVIRVGLPEGIMDRRSVDSDFQYIVGGYPFSLSTIRNGILRNNRRPPYSLAKPFGTGDRRLELTVLKVNPLIHFGLCDGTRSSPTVRFFSPQVVQSELRSAAREFFQNGGVEVDLEKRTLKLTRIMKWFSADFGQDREIPRWILSYLDATKAGLLTHLLSDGGPIHLAYQNYDWSVNS
ncbi:LOW QUALITY PROTEIN: uncharacterized protein LOC104422328 [Eucalyptus grandis]|uniref:LOW QUALITY PROTEIN: uncharacterized protein LOC104422328 n=1 Tax=Eucalyptus grandis TaxID=71139 RepID=UPI00192E8B55|nr:LOW QUALITY PROTEIN: uncharacterized protein LOC104422328 [Eucalyptus grandis]